MEAFQLFHSLHSPLFFLLLQISSLKAYTRPDYYFINCGADSNATVAGRNFVGDLNSGGSSSFSVSKSQATKNTSLSRSAFSLYQTARFYRKPFFYEFQIPQNGTYLVRLHFHPFSSPELNLSSANFNVSVPGFSLLSNFSVENGSSSSPLIEEFLLTINIGKFRIYFTPSSASLGFVNAIEVFIGFDGGGFVGSRSPLLVTPVGGGTKYSDLLSQALYTKHRFNVGGPAITPENDTLWRNWVPDDVYVTNGNAARNSYAYGGSLNYEIGGATEYTAPDIVYKTVKEMELDPKKEPKNITWRFGVRKNARHLVRAHFCDIISVAINVIKFNLYIYAKFHKKVDPYEVYAELAAPFCFDFVVDSDDSGFMDVSIVPRDDSLNQSAFLNGLEIMEFMKDSNFVVSQTGFVKKHLPLILGLVVGGALICIVLVSLLLGLRYRKLKKAGASRTSGSSSWPTYGVGGPRRKVSEGTPNASPVPHMNLGLKIPLSDLLRATNKFDKRLIIGEGGFGKVYKGILGDGTVVAVKRSEPGHGQGIPEFQSEISILSKVRHRHLVSLIGYCDDWPEMILVSEFMEKGTLRDHLYASKTADSKRSSAQSTLSWKQRLDICIGSAKGLHYLHTCSDRKIIHRDVKSTNILLDGNYFAKVSDFGLSKSHLLDQTHVSTDVKGSIGYIDPEYFRCLQLTEKSDVYSFAVVLLEVLCGRPAINTLLPREQVNLAEWGLHWQHRGQLENIVDSSIQGTIKPNSLRKFGEIVEKCLRESGAERPHMGDVLWELEYVLQLQQTDVQMQPHEDSIIDASLELSQSGIRRLPSSHFIDEDRMARSGGEFSDTISTGVFSEIRIDEAR